MAAQVIGGAVAEYIIEHEGEWPKQWEDLNGVFYEGETTGWKWPEHAEEMKKHIEFNFQFNVEQAVSAGGDMWFIRDPKNIDAIDPQMNACYNMVVELCRAKDTTWYQDEWQSLIDIWDIETKKYFIINN
ncbi:hypothetical protein JD969_02515 [Planctomycetota bacterium]|nr:hypothetical protein JD969_02515 [Planctomycetota bacterium]